MKLCSLCLRKSMLCFISFCIYDDADQNAQLLLILICLLAADLYPELMMAGAKKTFRYTISRREALGALYNLGDLTVETRPQNEKVAAHMTFDKSGLLTDERTTTWQAGTTINVKEVVLQLVYEMQIVPLQHSEGVWKVDFPTECKLNF
ncbi:hypothetical protein L1987_20809 [Smallanthus sonchifolius]|uniref:Uncharacterized protein n=1 Tax=Smallanthus sonchifolius TaxID=185202 RepID=A0ACB9ITU5_9ASTR|nr:hypothetical protein L1987_20809 [Smallanthus sonchifolius]